MFLTKVYFNMNVLDRCQELLFVREGVVWHVSLPVRSHGVNRLSESFFGYKAFRALIRQPLISS